MLKRFKRIWFAVRDWRDRHAVREDSTGAARITWNPRHVVYVRAWYRYCVDLFREELRRTHAPLQLVFGDYAAPRQSTLQVRRIGLQIEHTLVRPGGGDSAGAPLSRTRLPGADGWYLARVLGLNELLACDLVIDYSHINRAHLAAAEGFADYLRRCIVLAPLLYPPDLRTRSGAPVIITTFSDAQQGRRKRFLDIARRAGLAISNVKRCFDPDALARLYARSGILVNVRQSDHHDCFEELRVLPALLRGVLVISEEAPLREHLPYARYVIWSSLEQLPATIAAVQADYAGWHRRIFADPQWPQVVAEMAAANQAAVREVVQRWCAAVPGASGD